MYTFLILLTLFYDTRYGQVVKHFHNSVSISTQKKYEVAGNVFLQLQSYNVINKRIR